MVKRYVEEPFRAFLDYVNGKDVSGDQYIDELDDAVERARMNKEWRREYMTIEQINLHNQYIGKKIGWDIRVIS